MGNIIKQIACSQNPDSVCKMIWVDETYINYSGTVSLETMCLVLPELVVCKSMSKCYALSGLRVAYAVSQSMSMLKRYILLGRSVYRVSLRRLRPCATGAYYGEQYEVIHGERKKMQSALEKRLASECSRASPIVAHLFAWESSYSSVGFIEACRARGLFVRDAQNMGVSLPSNTSGVCRSFR